MKNACPFLADANHTAPATAAGAIAAAATCPVPKVARRIGVALFLFFLIKGLLWLIIPATIAAGTYWGWWTTNSAATSTPTTPVTTPATTQASSSQSPTP
jgi:hypothetical protein